jgi:hypothetical protein
METPTDPQLSVIAAPSSLPEKPARPAPRRSEPSRKNSHDFREPWLQDAIDRFRPMFDALEFPLPESIRASFGFTSAGKGPRLDESFAPEASADGTPEIFIAPDWGHHTICTKLHAKGDRSGGERRSVTRLAS